MQLSEGGRSLSDRFLRKRHGVATFAEVAWTTLEFHQQAHPTRLPHRTSFKPRSSVAHFLLPVKKGADHDEEPVRNIENCRVHEEIREVIRAGDQSRFVIWDNRLIRKRVRERGSLISWSSVISRVLLTRGEGSARFLCRCIESVYDRWGWFPASPMVDRFT